MTDIVVFSHLRWDFVYQRPQQLLSRLGKHHRICFVEEPVHSPGPAHLVIDSPCPGVNVWRPHTPVSADAHGFDADQLPALAGLIRKQMQADGIVAPLAWLYTPLALPLLHTVEPAAVIYDCMDELSAFHFAPPLLKTREAQLFERADLVLTGGPSLYEAKRRQHANVHCFPSSVDVAHFAPISQGANDRNPRSHPRLGFFGVIDERLDLDLIRALAQARPDWQIDMVGPVVKIPHESRPQEPNLHWLGQQPYEALPKLVQSWDLCLLPFALNEATRFISPTKTLEYMAAEKPVVSTAVRDVVALYGHAVEVAPDAPSFIAACQRVLAENSAERSARLAVMRATVAQHSWDATVAAIDQLISKMMRHVVQPADADHAAPAPGAAAPAHGAPTGNRVDHLIIGAGPTGLAAAHYLGQWAPASRTLLVEHEAAVGGWCRSVIDKGFTFDHAGHIMFSNEPEVLRLYGLLLGENVHWQNREAWVYSKGVHTRYPFQGALYGLPPSVLKECLMGAIEARDRARNAPPPRNFEEFIHSVWGDGVAKHFAIPYNRKLWAVPLAEMETSWLGGRVPLPNLEEMITGALEPVPAPMGPNARFGYPLRGGFQALMDGFLPLIHTPIELNTSVIEVIPQERRVRLRSRAVDPRAGGSHAAEAAERTLRYGKLVSTMPLPQLVAACGAAAPAAVHAAAAALRHVSVRCVNLGVARAGITDKHWIYYPEDTVFHRIFVQGNASPHNNPAGGFGLTCEITYSPDKPLPAEGQALIERCVADAIRVGMMQPEDTLITANEVDMPCAYVVYDHERASNVALIRDWLAGFDIVLAGRYSEWAYYNSDHAFMAGRKAAMDCLGQVDAPPVAATTGAVPAAATASTPVATTAPTLPLTAKEAALQRAA